MEYRIKELRKALQLTQEEFGEEIGVTKLTILRWERDNKVPEASLRLICRVFRVRRNWLETGEGEMFQTVAPHTSGEDGDASYSSPYGYALQQGFPVEFATLFARLCELSSEEKKSLGGLIAKVISPSPSGRSGNSEERGE